MGQFGPHPHFSSNCFAASWGCASVFIVGIGVDVGAWGIGQSFLDSNRFSDIEPVLGHGVPALAGMSSSGGGLSLAEEVSWGGFSFSFC